MKAATISWALRAISQKLVRRLTVRLRTRASSPRPASAYEMLVESDVEPARRGMLLSTTRHATRTR